MNGNQYINKHGEKDTVATVLLKSGQANISSREKHTLKSQFLKVL